MLQALPEHRKKDMAALMGEAMKQLARDDNTLWHLMLKKNKKVRQQYLFDKIKTYLKFLDIGNDAALIVDDPKYYSMEWDAPGGSVTVDIRGRHVTKVVFAMSLQTANYWGWGDRGIGRRFVRHPVRNEYTYMIPDHVNVDLVIKQIEHLYAARPRRLDFGVEAAH